MLDKNGTPPNDAISAATVKSDVPSVSNPPPNLSVPEMLTFSFANSVRFGM